MKKQTAVLLAAATLAGAGIACTTVTSIFTGAASVGVAPTPAGESSLPTSPAVSPAATEEPAVEPEATSPRRRELPPTPTPIELTSEDDPRRHVDLSEPSFQDRFDEPGTWFDYDTPGRAAYSFEEGHLLGVDYEPEEKNVWWSYVERSSGNVYAEISATNGDCIAKDSVGFAIRVDPEAAAGGYGIEVSCDGAWRFLRHYPGLPARELQEWAQSAAINTGAGATNRLAIWAYANELFAFINNEQVGRIVDRQRVYSYGTFAVYVRASQTYDLTATFDDFAFYHIPYIPE